MENKDNKFDQKRYIREYERQNYTQCRINLRSPEAAILSEYSQNLNISKNALLQKCLVYCYNNYIDVSNVKLSTPDKSQKTDIENK